jgi:hypothetical protein
MQALHRRRVLELLGTGSLAAQAGCLDVLPGSGAPDCTPRFGLRLRAVSDEEIAAETDRPPADLQPLARDLVEGARESGTATFDSARWVPPTDDRFPFRVFRRTGREPFPISLPGEPRHRFVRLPDGHKRIVVETVATAETTEYVFVARTTDEINERARPAQAFALDALPVHDRRTSLAFLRERADRSDINEFGSQWYVGFVQDGLVESSRLVPQPERPYLSVVDWYLELEPQETATGTRAVYEVSLDHVADSTDGFAAAVTDADGVDLDRADLSADQRDVLEEAAGGTYWQCLPVETATGDDVVWVDQDGERRKEGTEALAAVLTELGGARYAKHDGQWYSVGVTKSA